MGLFDNVRKRLLDWMFSGVIDDGYRERVNSILDRREYRIGMQKDNLKVRPGQANDNISSNFVSLVVDRSVSMLFGKGVKFEYGEDKEAQDTVDETWNKNKKDIFLHRLGMYGAEAGMAFIKIVPRFLDEELEYIK